MNSFGIYRTYTHGPPTITPDEYFTLSSVSDSLSMARDPARSHFKPSSSSSFDSSSPKSATTLNYFAPFLNASVFLLMSWYYNGSSIKSFRDIDKLVHNVIQHEDFKSSDFGNTFSSAREAERMDKEQSSKSGNSDTLPFSSKDGWIEGSVSIPVPCDGVQHESEEHAPRFVINGIWYRRPLEVIKKAFSELAAENFHMIPFKEYWKPSEHEPSERIYSETFTADVFNDEYDKLRKFKRYGPNSTLEPIVAGISFYSDSTHLTSFGNASLWPIYMYIGNQSKYLRAKPSEFAAHHIAYIPKVCILCLNTFKFSQLAALKLGDEIQDFYKKTYNKVATAAMLTHLRRELAHSIWTLLLDDDLMRAYADGEAVKLSDEIIRALFPRFLFYSADYPEK